MSQSPVIYEAKVYSRKIAYRNFKGEQVDIELHFSLDPLTLMEIIAGFEPKKVKSGNPARNGTTEVTEEQQLKFVRDIAVKAAGYPSTDGESWLPFTEFAETLAGKAFLTKLTSSDGDRKEFAEQVLLAPFRAFVGFAKVDPTNDTKDIKMFEDQLAQMENIFRVAEEKDLSLAEKQAILEAQMAELQRQAEAEGTE